MTISRQMAVAGLVMSLAYYPARGTSFETFCCLEDSGYILEASETAKLSVSLYGAAEV